MDNHTYFNNNTEPLLGTEKDILFNLDNLSVQFFHIQHSLKEVENLFNSLTQNEYSQGKSLLLTQQNKFNEYTSFYSKNKSSFSSFNNPSKDYQTKFNRYTQKIENLINLLRSKLNELELLAKKVKSRYNFEDIIDYIAPISTDNSILSLGQKQIESEVIEQKDYLDQRRKDLAQVKM